jgi:hypothetical protein
MTGTIRGRPANIRECSHEPQEPCAHGRRCRGRVFRLRPVQGPEVLTPVNKGILIRKAAFWGGVGGSVLLTQFFVKLAADKLPFRGLKDFVAYINNGNTGGSA